MMGYGSLPASGNTGDINEQATRGNCERGFSKSSACKAEAYRCLAEWCKLGHTSSHCGSTYRSIHFSFYIQDTCDLARSLATPGNFGRSLLPWAFSRDLELIFFLPVTQLSVLADVLSSHKLGPESSASFWGRIFVLFGTLSVLKL